MKKEKKKLPRITWEMDLQPRIKGSKKAYNRTKQKQEIRRMVRDE